MKSRLFIALLSSALLLALIVSAFAAEFTGSIWTNSPKRTLGVVYGYYCTAAQNRSSGGKGKYAKAESYLNGAVLAKAETTGNSRAVANSGLRKPDSGKGEYGERAGKATQKFGSGAYKDY